MVDLESDRSTGLRMMLTAFVGWLEEFGPIDGDSESSSE
jgi:hypothetical protein